MIGKQIANFRIVEKLGEGGMGVVYKGVDTHLDRPVAIKMLNAELAHNPEIVERFRTEAKAQANLNHANLATLYAFLVDDGLAFMVMEFVQGETFERLIRARGPLPPEFAVPLFKQTLLGMGAAHRAGIVHRDIKPSNLMLNSQGIVKVMDFGIAKIIGTRGLTSTGAQLGTPAYMAPEQIQNRTIDVRTDIYALGITLYQMLCGQLPFDTGSSFDTMNAQVSATPPPLTRMYPYAPVRYQNAVMKALEKDPNNRYQSVEEFGAALEHPESVAEPVATAPTLLGNQRTVMESAASVPASAPPRQPNAEIRPSPSDPVRPATVAPGQVAAKKTIWNTRNTIAAASAGAAVILLAVMVFARKPAVVGVGLGGNTPQASPSSSEPQETPQEPIALPIPSGSGEASSEGSADSERKAITLGASPSRPLPATITPKKVVVSGANTPPQSPAPNPPANGGMSPAEVDEVEHSIDQLSSRAAAINNSLDHLQRQQAASGYGLRGDMVSAQATMQTNLSKAQASMQQGDPVKAKKYAEIAGSSADILERFLGR